MATRPTRTEKGISLARGPALILGTILLAAGLYLMYRARTYPRFSTNFPNGTAHPDGKFIVGLFAANGWTGLFTAVCGGLLLFGAAQHLLAKTMSLIVGCALGAAAIIALISGDVLGMAAANHWTELGWGICALILLSNTLAPRRTRVVDEPVGRQPIGARRPFREPVAEREAGVAGTAGAAREPVADREAGAAGEPVADREAGAAGQPVADREAGAAGEPAVAREPAANRPAAGGTGGGDVAPAGGEQPTTPLRRE